jgi:hypothetical protein
VGAAIDRAGLTERLGPDHIHGNLHRAVEAQEASTRDGGVGSGDG